MIFALKMPSHPNIVRPIGVIMDSSEVVVEREGLVVEHLNRCPEVNRIELVSSLMFITLNR